MCQAQAAVQTQTAVLLQRGQLREKKDTDSEEIWVVPQLLTTFGNFWHGIPSKKLKHAFMAHVGAVPTSVEYIAVFSSGQQGIDKMRLQNPSVVSGSTGSYRSGGGFVLDELSMSGKFFTCTDDFCFNGGNSDKTLQLSIFDSLFDFQEDEETKQKLLEGYEAFLLDSVNSRDKTTKLKAVYLAGGSRGGCLMARLAKSLIAREDLNHVKFIVQSFDGVCRPDGEFGTTFRRTFNPLKKRGSNPSKWWYGYKTDVTKQFKKEHTERLCMRQIVGGEKVFTDLARGFTHKGWDCRKKHCKVPSKSRRRIYYEQTWTNLGHVELLSNHAHDSEIVKPMMEHFKTCKQRLSIL